MKRSFMDLMCVMQIDVFKYFNVKCRAIAFPYIIVDTFY